jgi:YXWGXW repeat-containing protein
MFTRKLLFCALIALSSAAMPAAAQININIGVAPPAPRYELVPAARSGYVWAPGFWRWEGQRHVWMDGHWLEARPGSRWVADRWEPRDGRHYYHPGKWERVSDRREREHEGKGNGKGNGKGWAKGHDRD